jgi:hypothetical protein
MLDKKELKNKYKQTLPKMGIFKITNLVNGKIFIGKGMNVPGKINSSKFQLNMGSHMNKEMQKDFKQLGEEKFSFEVVDYLDPKKDDEPGHDYTSDLSALEELWLEKLQPYGERGYNDRK